jgi:hypothetical protein
MLYVCTVHTYTRWQRPRLQVPTAATRDKRSDQVRPCEIGCSQAEKPDKWRACRNRRLKRYGVHACGGMQTAAEARSSRRVLVRDSGSLALGSADRIRTLTGHGGERAAGKATGRNDGERQIHWRG